MIALKLSKIGNAVGMVLPSSVLETLRVTVGDAIYLTASTNGFHLTSQLSRARKIARKRASVLKKLAK